MMMLLVYFVKKMLLHFEYMWHSMMLEQEEEILIYLEDQHRHQKHH